MLRLPFSLEAEYRGVEPASRFTRKDTGEVVDVPAKLRFEYEDTTGALELISVSQSQIDKAQGGQELVSIKRGQLVRLEGLVVLQDRGSDRDSYMQVRVATKLASTPVKVA